MKLLLLLGLVSAAVAAPGFQVTPRVYNYHEEVGIPKAALIKASEGAFEFDGARIAGGSAASLGQFPHMGGLIVATASGRDSYCGSSLISNTRLVTAAHCWFDGAQNARSLTVVLGSLRLFQGGTRIVSNQVRMHPHYNVDTIANDIAVIIIGHVGFNNNIRSINLASGSNNFAGSTAVAAGFGMTGIGLPITQNQILSHVSLPVITNQQCIQFYNSRFIIASTLCTQGIGGRNICSSDSGGPLHIGNTLIGVTSFFSGVCGANAPAGFARVTSFNSWIRQHM